MKSDGEKELLLAETGKSERGSVGEKQNHIPSLGRAAGSLWASADRWKYLPKPPVPGGVVNLVTVPLASPFYEGRGQQSPQFFTLFPLTMNKSHSYDLESFFL